MNLDALDELFVQATEHVINNPPATHVNQKVVERQKKADALPVEVGGDLIVIEQDIG